MSLISIRIKSPTPIGPLLVDIILKSGLVLMLRVKANIVLFTTALVRFMAFI